MKGFSHFVSTVTPARSRVCPPYQPTYSLIASTSAASPKGSSMTMRASFPFSRRILAKQAAEIRRELSSSRASLARSTRKAVCAASARFSLPTDQITTLARFRSRSIISVRCVRA